MKEVQHKNDNEISREWDQFAKERYLQISSGSDQTYLQTLCPLFIDEIKKHDFTSAIDIGCSVGYLTKQIAEHVPKVIGVDFSKVSIEIAKEKHASLNIIYLCENVNTISVPPVDLCTANMFLMDCLNLNKTISHISSLLIKGGSLLCTLPNPMMMPRYWGYEKRGWFNYLREIIIEADFLISNSVSKGHKTTHIHRPLSTYIKTLIDHGFQLIDFREITGKPLTGRLIKRYPRQLFLHLQKT